MKIINYRDINESFFTYDEMDELPSVARIIDDVRRHGDSAVKNYTLEFDDVEIDDLRVDEIEIENSLDALKKADRETLKAVATNIEKFAIRQKENFKDFEYELRPGVHTGQKVIPIRRVGVYAPGGRFPLPSTVLMCAIPARVAGVEEIVLVSPPTYRESIHPAILTAAHLCGIKEVYKIGGVQAIASLAFGTKTVGRVDKIVGPGNKYVTAAKKLVYGITGIDFIAGPTELLIIADKSANPAYIAADLLGQAEHDVNAVPLLVTDDIQFARTVQSKVNEQLKKLSTKHIAKTSLQKNGMIIIVDNIEDSIEVANRKAPEHLELQVRDLDGFAKQLKNYGSLFIGSLSAESLGDYSSGLNHTLPTNLTSRYTGGLSVKDFLKIQTTLRVNSHGLADIGPHAYQLGKMEGLEGHANSVKLRLEDLD